MPMGNRVNVAEMDSDAADDGDDIVGGNVEAECHGDNDDVEDGDDADDDEDSSSNDDEEYEYVIVEQFMRTFHNGDYDQEFDNALSSDRGVTLPTTRASYNKTDDWRERNRIGLEKVKEQLQECINSVMYNESGRVYLRVRHNSYQGQLMDNEEPIVWHEPILDEYWNRLEAKMNQLDIDTKFGTNVSGIHIENVEIKKERLAALVAMFHSGRATNSILSLDFNNANLCGEGIVCLSKLVDVSSQLQTFYLYHNRIDNMESARCLSRALKLNPRINTLSLPDCDLGSSPEILSVILQSDVSHIGLSNNYIDSLGAVKIAEYLEVDPPIHQIDLECNHLNDDDAVLISQALKRNTNLRQLDLHFNNLTSIGVKSLLTCVFDSSSLNAISESNHKLKYLVLFWYYHNDKLNYYTDTLLWLDSTQKILLALQDKDSLLKYLANVPVELMPEVLAFSQQDGNSRQHRYLNIVYSTMRWWNMPLLYSYHNCVKSDTKRKREIV
jgi:hypothetical protein